MEIIPKQEQKNIFGPQTFFVVAFVALVFVIGSFLLFSQLQAKSKKTIAGLEHALSAGGTKEQKKTEQEVISYQRKIADFGFLTRSKEDVSRFFQFLERSTQQKVFFNQVSFSVAERLMALDGEALDFNALDQQLLIFSGKNELEKVTLSNMNIGKNGRIPFSLRLLFKKF